MIGDVEPDDVYDATDPLPVRLAVIGRIVASLVTEYGTAPARADRRRRDVLRLLDGVVADLEALTGG